MSEFVFLHVVNALTTFSVFGVVTWGVVALARTRYGRANAATLPPGLLQSMDDRLARLEQQTEAIAIQVERIAEGQRFVTKLLSDPEPPPRQLVPPHA